jgi:hypothetical protein
LSYYEAYDQLTNEVVAIVWKHDGLFSFIPLDESNLDFQNYLLWMEQGNNAGVWNPTEHNLPVVTPDGVL